MELNWDRSAERVAEGSEYRAVCKQCGGRPSQPACPRGGAAWGANPSFSLQKTQTNPNRKPQLRNPVKTRGRETVGMRGGGESGGFGENDTDPEGIGGCIRQSKFKKPRAWHALLVREDAFTVDVRH